MGSLGRRPRGGQSLILAAKARAALYGRSEVSAEDIQAMAAAVLRHRVVLSYNAEADGQTPDSLIRRILDATPVYGGPAASDQRVQRVLQP